MSTGAAFRGQPLLLFGVIIAAWGGARMVTWEPLPPPHYVEDSVALASLQPEAEHPATLMPGRQDLVGIGWWGDRFGPYAAELPPALPVARLRRRPKHRRAGTPLDGMDYYGSDFARATYHPATAGVSGGPRPVAGYDMPRAVEGTGFSLPPAGTESSRKQDEAAGQQALGGSGLAMTPLTGIAGRIAKSRRLSVDSWIYLRQDSASVPTGIGGSYGGSQSGFVARYDLAPASRFQPRAYLRASRALAGLQDSEIAAGLSARPFPDVPVSVSGEARFYRTSSGEEFRPAVYAVTHFPPQSLPLGMQAETYFQGGYVGGKYATPFIDGQLRIDREFIRMGRFALRGGGGAWGGAQKGAERIDIGPALSLQFNDGKFNSRLSLDYRFRLAGDAAPGSGAALTLSAGF